MKDLVEKYWHYTLNILKNNYKDVYDNMIFAFEHGSYVYHTNTDKSDRDIIVIVNDSVDLSQYQNNIKEVHYFDDFEEFDFQVINDSHFKNMIYEHHIIALESLWLDPISYTDYELFQKQYGNLFILDKWKLRQVISSIVNNSYAKCHKKLTVEKDYDLYRAQKSIFHCVRLYKFAIQIATYNKIIDYTAANEYWDMIKNMGNDWDEYKKIFKPILNSYRSELVLLCPKPV